MVAISRMFYLAGLVHRDRRVLGLPSSHGSVQNRVAEMLLNIDFLSRSVEMEPCLIFPFITAGCEIQRLEQRQMILEQCGRIEKLGLTCVRILEILG